MRPADELRTLEEKSRSAGLVTEEAAPDTLAEAPAAELEIPDPLSEETGEAALFGDPGAGASDWLGAPEAPGPAEPLAGSGPDLPWGPTLPAPESSPESAAQRYGAAGWDLSDPDVAAWITWCEEQGLDPSDPDLLAWANWYYQEQLEGRAAQIETAAAPDADAAAPDPVLAEPAEASEPGSSHDWSAGVPDDFADALTAEGPGTFGSPVSDLSAVLEGDEQTSPLASPDDGTSGGFELFEAEPAAEDDLGTPADDLGPILEVGIDVFEVVDNEPAPPNELAPPEWVPRASSPHAESSPPAPSEPASPAPVESEPTLSASSSPAPEPLPSEPLPSEPDLPVLDAAAFGMVALESPEQPETALFDLEQAAASLAELEASLQGDVPTDALDRGASAEQAESPAPSEPAPAPLVEEEELEPVESSAPESDLSIEEATSSFTQEPAEPAAAGEPSTGAQEPRAEPAPITGTHRVVLHTSEGEVKRGTVTDFALEGNEVALELPGGGTESLPVEHIRAIFFMLDAGESPPAPEGKRVRVTFRDGRQVAGFSPDYDPERGGFFVIPTDARSHTARIWVYRAAVRQLSVT